jgi:hypothetical protein
MTGFLTNEITKSSVHQPIRLQEMNQSEEGDLFYFRVRTIYTVTESSLALWIFGHTNTMQREHHQALTRNYVLLMNETPVGEDLEELVQNKIRSHEMREYIRHHPTRKGRTRALLERRFGVDAYQPRHRRHGHVFPGTIEFSFGRKPITDCRPRRNPAD